MKWKWSFAGIYMLTDFMFMYIFNFLIAKFLVMWPKMYFYLYVEQIQLLITPLLFGQLTEKLAENYIRVASASMHCIKSLLVVFLAIWPKMPFHSFFITSHWLLNWVKPNLVSKYMLIVCLFMYNFMSPVNLVLVLLPKNAF